MKRGKIRDFHVYGIVLGLTVFLQQTHLIWAQTPTNIVSAKGTPGLSSTQNDPTKIKSKLCEADPFSCLPDELSDDVLKKSYDQIKSIELGCDPNIQDSFAVPESWESLAAAAAAAADSKKDPALQSSPMKVPELVGRDAVSITRESKGLSCNLLFGRDKMKFFTDAKNSIQKANNADWVMAFLGKRINPQTRAVERLKGPACLKDFDRIKDPKVSSSMKDFGFQESKGYGSRFYLRQMFEHLEDNPRAYTALSLTFPETLKEANLGYVLQRHHYYGDGQVLNSKAELGVGISEKNVLGQECNRFCSYKVHQDGTFSNDWHIAAEGAKPGACQLEDSWIRGLAVYRGFAHEQETLLKLNHSLNMARENAYQDIVDMDGAKACAPWAAEIKQATYHIKSGLFTYYRTLSNLKVDNKLPVEQQKKLKNGWKDQISLCQYAVFCTGANETINKDMDVCKVTKEKIEKAKAAGNTKIPELNINFEALSDHGVCSMIMAQEKLFMMWLSFLRCEVKAGVQKDIVGQNIVRDLGARSDIWDLADASEFGDVFTMMAGDNDIGNEEDPKITHIFNLLYQLRTNEFFNRVYTMFECPSAQNCSLSDLITNPSRCVAQSCTVKSTAAAVNARISQAYSEITSQQDPAYKSIAEAIRDGAK